MKIPLVEVAECLNLQDPLNKAVDDSKTVWALHCQGKHLAVSIGSAVAIFQSTGRAGNAENSSSTVLSRLSAVQIQAPPHRITTLCWLTRVIPQSQVRSQWELHGADVSGQKADEEVDLLASHLMVGNEKGEFMVYDLTGDLVLRQRLHAGPVLNIQSRPASMGLESEALEDVSVVYADVLCCIPLPELLAFIRLHEAGSGQVQDPTLKLAHGKFGFGKNHSNRADGLHLGIQNPSLKAQLKKADTESEDTIVSILTVGRSPAMGSFSATVRGSKGGAFALFGKLASSVTLGFSSAAWKSGRKVLKGGMRSWWSGNKEDEITPAESTTIQFSLRDNKRHLQKLIPAPQDSLAVAADNLGRVLLIDTQQSLVLRIWKGYRDAQCAWMTRSAAKSEPPRLYLVLYGWRRETLEIWQMRYGPRVFSAAVGPKCKLLPATPPMGLADTHRWDLKCGVLDYENEEIWDVGGRAFSGSSKVEAIWDMMLKP